VRQFAQNGGALPADEVLKQEMLAVDAWYDERGRLQLETKKDVNAKVHRLGLAQRPQLAALLER
jgi:hypothetical protein